MVSYPSLLELIGAIIHTHTPDLYMWLIELITCPSRFCSVLICFFLILSLVAGHDPLWHDILEWRLYDFTGFHS